MFDNSPNARNALLGAVAVMACSAGIAHAEPARRADVAPVMALGAAAIPPIGFLDLCDRSPQACGVDEGRLVDVSALRTAAMQKYWADTFAQRRTAPAAAAENTVDWTRVFADARRGMAAPRIMDRVAVSREVVVVETAPEGEVALIAPAPGNASGDVGIAIAAEDVAASAVDVDAGPMTAFAASATDVVSASAELSPVVEASVEVVDAETPAVTFALDREGWKLVNGVNRRINRSIRQTADSRLYGMEDFWTLPSAGRGDCEDFVLAKREALIEAGVPAEALSIAIVETRWGESHAVLLLASDRGEYVLDSLSPWVSRWDRVDYDWKERQRPGRPFDWVTAAI